MKFEFEIPDDVFNECVKKQVKSINNSHGYASLNHIVKRHIDNVITDHLDSQVREQLTVSLSDRIEKALDTKVDGWLKRRIKESLEKVRKQMEQTND